MYGCVVMIGVSALELECPEISRGIFFVPRGTVGRGGVLSK